jgi:MAP3K TRAFs-binding domain
MMRICYVAMPYGVKLRADGQHQDFDFFFEQGLKPALTALGIECRRFDDFGMSAFWQRSMFTGIISSDVMIADISTGNPNVLYELGVRHALKRGRTILIAASGEPPPYNIAYAPILRYDLDPSGRPDAEAMSRFRDRLVSVLRQSARSTISDSPIYEFFPDIETILPPELASESTPPKKPVRRSAGGAKRSFAQAAIESPKQVVEELKKSEREVRAAPDPIELLTLLRRYRDLSEWDSVISLAEDAPDSSQSPEVRQILALALNRRGGSGDQERAIALMEALVAETGGDSETFGVLGRIFKDKYNEAAAGKRSSEAADCLERALHYYRAGFEKSKDIYSGVNVVSLLQERTDAAARIEVEELVPRIRAIVQGRIEAGLESGRVDYWDLATELELAVASRDWPAAATAAERIRQNATPGWMIETTMQSLERYPARLSDPADRARLDQIINRLQEAIEAA